MASNDLTAPTEANETSAEEGSSQIFLEMLHWMVPSPAVSQESAEWRKRKAD